MCLLLYIVRSEYIKLWCPYVWVLWSLKVIYRLPFNCVTLIHLIDFYNVENASDMWQHLILLFTHGQNTTSSPFLSLIFSTPLPSVICPNHMLPNENGIRGAVWMCNHKVWVVNDFNRSQSSFIINGWDREGRRKYFVSAIENKEKIGANRINRRHKVLLVYYFICDYIILSIWWCNLSVLYPPIWRVYTICLKHDNVEAFF